MRVPIPLLSSLTWMRIYRKKALLARHPMIMMVPRYTLARYSSMENPEHIAWVPTSFCDNPSLSLPNESVPALSEFVVICEAILFFEALPRPCSLVCHVLFLSMSPVGWWFPPRCAPDRGLWLSATVSLWRFWPRFSVCRILGRPYQLDGGSHCLGKVIFIFCKNVYPLSEGIVSWLCQTDFVALRRQMMTQGFSSALVGSIQVICLRFLNVQVKCTTYNIFQTAWLQWLWRCIWKRQDFR